MVEQHTPATAHSGSHSSELATNCIRSRTYQRACMLTPPPPRPSIRPPVRPSRRCTRTYPCVKKLSTDPTTKTRSAREAFIRNHPLPEPLTSYEDNLKDSPKLIGEMERALWELESMILSPDSVSATDGKLSYDDITLFPRMRGLTIIQDLGIPPKLRAYLDAVSERCDIPL